MKKKLLIIYKRLTFDKSSHIINKSLTDSSSQSDSGTIVLVNYCDITYFDDPTYVGTTSTF